MRRETRLVRPLRIVFFIAHTHTHTHKQKQHIYPVPTLISLNAHHVFDAVLRQHEALCRRCCRRRPPPPSSNATDSRPSCFSSTHFLYSIAAHTHTLLFSCLRLPSLFAPFQTAGFGELVSAAGPT